MLLGELAITVDGYLGEHKRMMEFISRSETEEYLERALEAKRKSQPILLMGNGGSAANADHAATDLAKAGLYALSLTANAPLLTATANDLGFKSLFEALTARFAAGHSAPLVVLMSVSGNSQNICDALLYAADMGIASVLMTGMEGGRAGDLRLADVHINIPSKNYGVVEDLHMAVHHAVAQIIGGQNERAGQEEEAR